MKKYLIVLIVVLIIVSICGVVWVYLNNQKPTGPTITIKNNESVVPISQNNNPDVSTLKFTDDELGISFDYPKSWGGTVIDIKADSRSLTKKISFHNQSSLYMEAISPALRSDIDNLQIPEDTVVDWSNFCGENLISNRVDPLSSTTDIYRINGSDEFGFCPGPKNVSAVVYRTDKTIDSGTVPGNEIVTWENLNKTIGSATLKFSKRYYLKIANPLYSLLIIYQSGISEVKSHNYCYGKWPVNNNPAEYLRTYKCLSYKDKTLIEEKFFSEVDNSEFNKEVAVILDEIKIIGVAEANKYFTDHFSSLAQYKGARYNYEYPKILVPDKWSDETVFNVIKIVTRESAVKAEEDAKSCEGPCYDPTLTSLGWDNEKKLLESNPLDGSAKCVQGINGRSLCEIKTYGRNKFLIRYTGRGGGDSVVKKIYIIYKNDIRYEITSPELYSKGTDPVLFKGIDNQLIQKVYDGIVKSLSF